ncbi:MAG: hypothetical protein F4175_20630 [Gemmatimonadetes bacterium]|nr:hypothetical protein [Gemmatimonadota bacterium]
MKKIIWVALLVVFGTFGWGHAQLSDAPNKVRPLMVGDEVPALTLADANGRDFDLGAHKNSDFLSGILVTALPTAVGTTARTEVTVG